MAIVNISPVTWKCLAPNNIYKLKKEEEISRRVNKGKLGLNKVQKLKKEMPCHCHLPKPA